jgi:GNAT superfamily N-acetyltransferase
LGELLALYVDPGSWGKGIGRRLLVEARARLAGRGFVEAILWVLAGNERAERFYRVDGWRPDGARRHDEIWGVTADEVRYRRALP